MGCGTTGVLHLCAATRAATLFPALGGRLLPLGGSGAGIRLWLGAGSPGDVAFSMLVGVQQRGCGQSTSALPDR